MNPKCLKCGEEAVLCSFGAWNCPKCFSFIRKATKEELKIKFYGNRQAQNQG